MSRRRKVGSYATEHAAAKKRASKTPKLKTAPPVEWGSLDSATAKVRRAERTRRSATAQSRAQTILALRYQEEYRELYDAFLVEVHAERGDLP